MGWESRGNGRYYYTKRRYGQQVVGQYMGKGKFAEAIATLDKVEQQKRLMGREEKRLLQHELDTDKDMDRQLNAVWHLTRQLLTAVLLLNGYHAHKGQWRKWQKS